MSHIPAHRITEQEARAKVPSKKFLYDALLRNDFYMAPYKSKCMTIDYMENVRLGYVWVPKHEQVRKRPCPTPPLKRVIYEVISNAANEFSVDLGFRDEHDVGVDYLLDILSTICPDHEFFHKSYVPAAEDSKFQR